MSRGSAIAGPRQLHELHEDLLHLLMMPQAPGIALLQRARFVEIALDAGWAAWVAYGFAVARRLARAIPRGTLHGWSPGEISRLAELLERCLATETIDVAGAREWPAEARRAVDHLASARQALEVVLRGEDPRATPGPSAEAVGTIRIPVVAAVLDGGRTSLVAAGYKTGQLLGLAVHARLSRDRHRSAELVVEGELRPDAREAFREAIEATRTLGPRFGPPWRQLFISARWDQAGAQLIGGSAGLGFGLAMLSAWNVMAPGWRERVLERGVAATGILSGGRILPVESSTVGLKARACFYSPVRTLLVPRSQIDLADRALEDLRRTHPGRRMHVQGVENLRELAAGVFTPVRRTARQTAASCVRAAARSRARRIVAAATLLVVAAFLVWLSIVTRNQPVHAEWEGDHVVLRNKYDWVTLKLHLPGAPSANAIPPGTWGGPLHLWDLDGDEKADLLAAHCSQVNTADYLSAFDRRGRLLWRRPSACGPPEGPVEDADLVWRHLYGPLRAPIGTPGFLTIRRSPQRGDSYLEYLDGSTGAPLGRLHNAGHIDLVVRVDVDASGTADLIALGTHMPTASGLMAVLDPEALATSSPSESQAAEVVELADPASLGKGVRLALLFAKDRFTTAERVHCNAVVRKPGNRVRVDATGDADHGAVMYTFAIGPGMALQLEQVRISDGQLIAIRNGATHEVTEQDIDTECRRLAAEVRMLTPTGWVALCGPGPR